MPYTKKANKAPNRPIISKDNISAYLPSLASLLHLQLTTSPTGFEAANYLF
jgi:hypothetical protein